MSSPHASSDPRDVQSPSGSSISRPRPAGSSHAPRSPDLGDSTRAQDAPVLPQQDSDATILSKRPLAGLASDGSSQGLALGQTLDHFVIRQLVGEGGMGAVYRAFDTLLLREVAIKILHSEVAADQDIVARFQQEAQSAARLRHPNIAGVYHFGQTEHWRYLVFEFVEGRNLRELVRSAGPLAWQDSLRIVREVTSALDHAHRRGVVHRDIKPSNLILTASEGVKVVDMGLARVRDRESAQQDLTASGMTLGTFDYISPEQARDPRDADVRSDLYSLGCAWYYLLTATPPFPEGSPLQKLLQHQGELAPDPRDRRPDIPAELAAVLARLLAKSPADRYQRPAELARDLDALAHQHALDDFAPPLASPKPPVASWANLWTWAVPFASLALLLILLDWNSRGFDKQGALPEPPVQSFRAPQDPLDTSSRKAPRLTREAPRSEADPAEDFQMSGLSVLEQAGKYFRPLEGADAVKSSSGNTNASSPNKQDAGFRDPANLAGNEASKTLIPSGRDETTGRPRVPSETAREALPIAPVPKPDSPDLVAEGSRRQPPTYSVRTVSPSPGPGQFASLADALRSLSYVDSSKSTPESVVIELDFDGRKVEAPCALMASKRGTSQNVIIRPAFGRRPVVVFRPQDSGQQEANALEISDQFLLEEKAQLELENIHLELLLPAARSSFPRNWNLFASKAAKSLTLRNCSLTVARPESSALKDGGKAAFVSLKSPSIPFPYGGNTAASTSVILEDCVVRGDAALASANSGVGVELNWLNGFYGSHEKMLETVSSPSGLAPPPACQFRIQRVTALCSGMLRMNVGARGDVHPRVALICGSSVFRLGSDSPLVEIAGGSSQAQQSTGDFRWTSQTPNLFLGAKYYLRFWPGENLYDMNLAEWRTQFSSAVLDQSSIEDPWKSKLSSTRTAELSPSDFQTTNLPFLDLLPPELIESGCRLQQLPAVPGSGL